MSIVSGIQIAEMRMIDTASFQYKAIHALLLPLLKNIVQTIPGFDPLDACVMEYEKDPNNTSDYIYHLMPMAANFNLQPYTKAQISFFDDLVKRSQGIDSGVNYLPQIMKVFLYGYFHKANGDKLPDFARTHALFQRIVYLFTHSFSKDMLREIHDAAKLCLKNDPSREMDELIHKQMEALVSATDAALSSKPYPKTACLYGPYSHFYIDNGVYSQAEDAESSRNRVVVKRCANI